MIFQGYLPSIRLQCWAISHAVQLRGSVSSNLIFAQPGTRIPNFYDAWTDTIYAAGFYLRPGNGTDWAHNEAYNIEDPGYAQKRMYFSPPTAVDNSEGSVASYGTRPSNTTCKCWLRVS